MFSSSMSVISRDISKDEKLKKALKERERRERENELINSMRRFLVQSGTKQFIKMEKADVLENIRQYCYSSRKDINWRASDLSSPSSSSISSQTWKDDDSRNKKALKERERRERENELINDLKRFVMRLGNNHFLRMERADVLEHILNYCYAQERKLLLERNLPQTSFNINTLLWNVSVRPVTSFLDSPIRRPDFKISRFSVADSLLTSPSSSASTSPMTSSVFDSPSSSSSPMTSSSSSSLFDSPMTSSSSSDDSLLSPDSPVTTKKLWRPYEY